MLPNHSPLAIAEQFGTLASLYPGRIDLGLGRAPGSDHVTARALRRSLSSDVNDFPRDVIELQEYFSVDSKNPVTAVPGRGLDVPLWILGSSLYGAQLAAALGLPYAFASHFAPQQMMQAIQIYRATFKPSAQLSKPYVMLGFNVFAADTDEEALFHATSMQQAFLNLRIGKMSALPPPVAGLSAGFDRQERAFLDSMMSCSAIGSLEAVRQQLNAFIDDTGADELMVTSQTFDHTARLRSYELTATIMAEEALVA
jgi:luciferase family oxidoreductase group 1